jgi:hypothetical protein
VAQIVNIGRLYNGEAAITSQQFPRIACNRLTVS